MNKEERHHTNHDYKNKIVNGLDLNYISEAPLRVLVMARVNVSPKNAFRLMAIDIHKWFPGVEKFSWDHSRSSRKDTFGIGSVRNGSHNGDKMVEVVREWDSPNYYVYQIDLDKTDAFIPIKNHMGIFTIESDSNKGSLITWRQYFDSKIPLAGPIVAWVMEDFIAENAFDNLVKKFGGERVEPD